MVKKVAALLMVCVMLFALAACGNNDKTSEENKATSSDNTNISTEQTQQSNETEDVSAETEPDTETESNNSLVVYFSATGNTKAVAETLADMQGADLYEIVPEEPYTDEDLDYSDRSHRATAEQDDANARPAISGGIDNIADYDVIYVGYPIWWGDMPRILYTFFDTYDLAGKAIAPFCTSGGSGLSGTPDVIAELEPEATVLEGLHTSSSGAESDLAEWVSSIGL